MCFDCLRTPSCVLTLQLNKVGDCETNKVGIAKHLQATHYFNTLSEDALMVTMWYLMDNHSRPHRWYKVKSSRRCY